MALSDLHFTGDTEIKSVLQPIEADLRDELKVGSLVYLVVSGDFADKCNEAGWERAQEFVRQLSEQFKVDALRVVVVPGNHDYVQSMDHFTVSLDLLSTDKEGHPVVGGVSVPNARYLTRFERFQKFYHLQYTAKPYADDPARQFDIFDDPDTGLRFLALNSAWEIDRFDPERASLNIPALSAALREKGEKPRLGILVWPHALTGDRKVADTQAIERLAKAGYRILLHGDVHEERDAVISHLDTQKKIHVVGGGAFGAWANARPESKPRLYSLLEVKRDLSEVRVIRRQQKTPEGPYDVYAVYPGTDKRTRVGEYIIDTGELASR